MVESLNYDALLDRLGDVYEQAISCSQEPGWEEYLSEGNFVASRKLLEGGLISIKVDIFVDRSPKALCDYVFNQSTAAAKKLQGDLLESSETVRTFNDDAILIHDKTLPLGPVSPREMYVLSVRRELGEGNWAIMSCSPDGLPTTDGYVQGDVKFSLYLFETVGGDQNKSKFSITLALDPKGSIPQMIVNSVAEKRGNYFKLLVQEFLAQ